jgi:hypothetical protein
MKISDAGKIAAAIGVLAAVLAGPAAGARAASGRINIQTVPEGVRFLIVTKKDLAPVGEGTTPFYDTAFATGKYRVCFELAGFQTEWQDASVSTFGSAWLGPVMTLSGGAASVSCADEVTRMKAEFSVIKASVLDKVMQLPYEPGAAPAAAPGASPARPGYVGYEEDTNRESRLRDAAATMDKQQAQELRNKVQEKRGAVAK